MREYLQRLSWPRCQYCQQRTEYTRDSLLLFPLEGEPQVIHGEFCAECAERGIYLTDDLMNYFYGTHRMPIKTARIWLSSMFYKWSMWLYGKPNHWNVEITHLFWNNEYNTVVTIATRKLQHETTESETT